MLVQECLISSPPTRPPPISGCPSASSTSWWPTRAVPCSKVTGRWLFPKAALDRWVSAGLLTTAPLAQPAPPIVGGSHDPLLEWALRESGSGLATLPEGSEAGLRRLARGEVMAAAIHLHRIDGDDDSANAEAVANAPGLHDVVVIAFARREQGLLVAPGNPLKLSDIASVAAARARIALRPNGAGAQLLLLALLARAGLAFEALKQCSNGATAAARPMETDALVHVYRYTIDRIALPEIDFSVLCSKGFYVRTYVHDIGEALGCGAHLKSLRRTKSGRFDVANAITVDEIKNATREEILKRMLSLPEVSRMRGA